ncbi:MAG TPA: HTTM domain-containing protein [Polyangiales bacterium]|nr:HTTM domain-containing protein [Polyangiales bacterium]
MAKLFRSLRATYLAADPRSLGLFRVGLALLLLADLAHRYQGLDLWYTNAGLLPNHTLLWRPPAEHMFSLFFLASSRGEAQLGFALCAIVYLCFGLGYRTRWAHAAALICRVSLNSRLAVIENGGDMVINILCIFTLALPLGRRFSLDAWRAALRPSPLTAADDPNQPVHSLAMAGLIIQFALIYFFNVFSKQGNAWTQGEAVHFALHLDKFVTPLGVWVREHAPVEALRLMTWSVLVTEWLGFALLITPVFKDSARAIAILVMPLLHLSFALGLDLGLFSPAMIAFYPLLITRAHWDALARWRGQPAPQPVARVARMHRARLIPELAVAALIFAIATEIVNDNTSVPPSWRWSRTAFTRALIEYPRLLQGWRMFAPNPPQEDSMIYIDATTARGERVDPYNQMASRMAAPVADSVPQRLGQSQFFTMYSDRIAYPNFAPYRQALHEWLMAHPTRTGQREDCLLSYDAYLIVDASPALGSQTPRPIKRERFLYYRTPKDDACQPIESKQDPRVASADSSH